MTYKVIFSKASEDDLDETLEFISRKLYNPSAAQRLLDKVSDTVSLLEENPMLFKARLEIYRYCELSALL